jgi:Domain of unknown function (DUF4326)
MYVAHVRDGWSKKHVYIGRASGSRPASPLANPYRVHNHTKEEHARVCRMYRRWLHTRLQAGDARVWEALRNLRPDSVLACYCAPLPCHGHVIERAWQWAVREGLINPRPYTRTDAEIFAGVAEQNTQALANIAREEEQAAQVVAAMAPPPPPQTRKARTARRTKTQRDLARASALLAQYQPPLETETFSVTEIAYITDAEVALV